MACKVQLFFVLGTDGWSETYYNSSTDPQALLAHLQTDARFASNPPDIISARLGMLIESAYLAGIRVSLDSGSRQTFSVEYAANSITGTYPGSAAELWSSLLVRFQTTGLAIHRKNLFLGGIPETIIKPDHGFDSSNSKFNGYFTQFQIAIKNLGWQVKSRPGTVGPTTLPITAFVPSSDGRSATIAPVVPTATVGVPFFLLIRGMKYPRGWNGTHTALVYQITAVPLVLGMKVGPDKKAGVSLPPWDQNSAGTLTPFVPIYTNISLISAIKIVERKRGRPFDQLRGRR